MHETDPIYDESNKDLLFLKRFMIYSYRRNRVYGILGIIVGFFYMYCVHIEVLILTIGTRKFVFY